MDHVDLCVIGAGSGNSLIDDRFSPYTVALVDAGRHFGGTCLTAGCIPTKMMVLPADLAASVTEAHRLGVDLAFQGANWAAIRDRIFRDRIDLISASGLAWRQQQPNVAVHRQLGRFIDPHTLELADGHQIRAERFVLAAGSRPRVPEVPGFDDAALAEVIHTSDTVMRIDALPRRMVILGGGFVAAEFAHVFGAFGVDVTLVHRGDRLLRHCDHEISRRFTEGIAHEVTLALNETLVRLEPGAEGGAVVVTRTADGTERRHETDLVLNATGRVPNSDTLNLEAAGVAVHSESGLVVVDHEQRTTQPHIWAMGDICSPSMLKHVANHETRVVQHNVVVDITGAGHAIEANHRFIPSAVFSEPQIGQVGATEDELRAVGAPYLVHVQEYGSVAYGWALEDTTSCVKLLADPTSRTLLGAHFVGPQAATLVQQCIQAMNAGTDIETMARGQYWIHPALPEVIENALLALAASDPVMP